MKLRVILGEVKKSEVDSSDSLRYTSNWFGGKLQVTQVTWTKKNIHFVDSVCRFVCVRHKQIQHYLSQDNSYLLDSGSYGATCIYVNPG